MKPCNKEIARSEGILAETSSGAAAWAAVEVAKRTESQGKNIVVLLPDTRERYRNSKFKKMVKCD
jgi:cysteine synthase A